MGYITRYSKPAFTILPKIIWAYFAWLKRYSYKKFQTIPYEKRYKKIHKLVKKLSKSLDIDIIIEGLENVPLETNVYFVGNHIGDYDGIILIDILEKPISLVGKVEIMNYPLISTALKYLEGEFLNRNDLKQSLKVMKNVLESLKNDNKDWAIFPDGTRRKDEKRLMADFHHGTFRMPMKAEVPIIPFAIIGTNRIFKGKPHYKQYPVHIKFLKPITSDYYDGKSTEEVAKFCQNEIQKAISFDLRLKDHQYMIDHNNKKYKAL